MIATGQLRQDSIATRHAQHMPHEPFLFVTVGSTDFDALVATVDAVVPALQNQAGIMQIGSGQYEPLNLPYFRYAPTLDTYYERATLVVAHGGLAVTMEVLARGVPLVSVSNADRYDQHQADLLARLADEGYLWWCRSLDQLGEMIETAQHTRLRPYQPPQSTIHRAIDAFLHTA